MNELYDCEAIMYISISVLESYKMKEKIEFYFLHSEIKITKPQHFQSHQ